MITTYLKQTIDYLIDNFPAEVKRHFNLSFTIGVVSGLFALVVAVIFVFIVGTLLGYVDLEKGMEGIYEAMTTKQISTNFYGLVTALAILWFGLYGSFIISCVNDIRLQTKETYKWDDFRSFISPEEWAWFIKFAGGLLVIYLITFKGLKDWFYSPIQSRNILDGIVDGLPYQGSFMMRLLDWIDSIFLLAREFAPYFFAVLFIVTVYENKIDAQIRRKYKDGILVAFFLAFVVHSLIGIFNGYVLRYVVGLLDVIFYHSITMMIPVVIRIVFILSAVAFFNWLIAASLCIPIKLVAEQGYGTESELLSQSPDTEDKDSQPSE